MTGASPGQPGPEVAERALKLGAEASPDAAGQLVTMTEGRRRPLEEARHLLSDRLHRRSDDFAATRALRVVGAALSRIGWEPPYVRPRDPRRRLSSVLWPWSGRQGRERGRRRQHRPEWGSGRVAGQVKARVQPV
jgi:hypothetical protein